MNDQVGLNLIAIALGACREQRDAIRAAQPKAAREAVRLVLESLRPKYDGKSHIDLDFPKAAEGYSSAEFKITAMDAFERALLQSQSIAEFHVFGEQARALRDEADALTPACDAAELEVRQLVKRGAFDEPIETARAAEAALRVKRNRLYEQADTLTEKRRVLARDHRDLFLEEGVSFDPA